MNDSDELVPREQLRVMQIVAGAMIFGLLTFLAIVLVLFGGQGAQPEPQLPILSLVAAVMLVGCLPMSIVLPMIITKAALRQILDGTWKTPAGATREQFATTPAKLLGVRLTATIVGLALLEGTGFVACVAYIVEHKVQVLGIVVVALLMMLTKFPTKRSMSAWLEQQTQELLDLQRAKNSETR